MLKMDRYVNILKLKRMNLRIKLLKELNCYLKSKIKLRNYKINFIFKNYSWFYERKRDLLIINIICFNISF